MLTPSRLAHAAEDERNMILRLAGPMRRGLALAAAVALALAPLEPGDADAAAQQTAITASTAGRGGEPGATPDQLGPMTNFEMQGYGCLATGGAATAAAALADSNELVLIFAGGTVPPSTPIALVLAVTGTIFASFCAVGALATPAVVRMWKYYYDGIPVAAPP